MEDIITIELDIPTGGAIYHKSLALLADNGYSLTASEPSSKGTRYEFQQVPPESDKVLQQVKPVVVCPECLTAIAEGIGGPNEAGKPCWRCSSRYIRVLIPVSS